MKKLLVLAVAALMTFAACSGDTPSVRNDLTADELCLEILEEIGANMDELGKSDEARAKAESLTAIDFELVESYVVYTSTVSTSLNEIVVIKATNESHTGNLEEQLETSLDNTKEIKKTYSDYLPDEYKNVEDAEVEQKGLYIMYAVFDDETADKAETAFENALSQ